MLKYDYTGAAALWDEYETTCICYPHFDGVERQEERRRFLRALTRENAHDKQIYIDFIKQNIEDARPVADAKNRFYDFDWEREQEEIAQKIIDFKGVTL